MPVRIAKTINEFEYVDDSIINIRAKAGMHRVAWTYPEYAFVEGTSFSVAYATAMTNKTCGKWLP